MQYYHTPRGSAPLPPTPLLEVALAPKIHQKSYPKTHRKKGTSLGTLLATPATKKEYSGELGSQNTSKMESKTEPKVKKMESVEKHEKPTFGCYLLHLSHVDRLQKGSFFDDFW